MSTKLVSQQKSYFILIRTKKYYLISDFSSIIFQYRSQSFNNNCLCHPYLIYFSSSVVHSSGQVIISQNINRKIAAPINVFIKVKTAELFAKNCTMKLIVRLVAHDQSCMVQIWPRAHHVFPLIQRQTSGALPDFERRRVCSADNNFRFQFEALDWKINLLPEIITRRVRARSPSVIDKWSLNGRPLVGKRPADRPVF